MFCRAPGAAATRSTSSATRRDSAMPTRLRRCSTTARSTLLVLNCPTALTPSGEAARAVIDTLAEERPRKRHAERNVFTAWLGEHSAGEARRLFAAARIPTYETADSAVRGFVHRVRHRRNQELLMQTPA